MKRILLIMILAVNVFLIYRISANGLAAIESSLKWIQDGRSGVDVPYFDSYRKEAIDREDIRLHTWQDLLRNIRVTIIVVALLTPALLIGVRKEELDPAHLFKAQKHQGLAIFLFYVLLCVSVGAVFYWLDFVPNANNDLSITTTVTLVFLSPVVFFVAYRANQREIALQLHRNEWLSMVLVFLIAVSIVLALIAIVFLDPGPFFNFG